jgi:hypothetical protein
MAEKSAQFDGLPPFTPEQQEQLRDALISGYKVPDLSDRLGYRMGIRPDVEIETTGGSRLVFGRLVDWAVERGLERDLLALAWSGRKDNALLKAEATATLPDTAAAFDLYEKRQLPPAPASLEAMVTARSRILDFDTFEQMFEAIRTGVCKIEGIKSGTGFLIGSRTVLTNYHVVEKELKAPPLAEAITCVFDFHGGAAGTPARLEIGNPFGPSSLYSQSDLTGIGGPSPGELDFAVLHLAEPVGTERKRWSFADRAPVVLPGDVALVAQHAEAQTLGIALGTVVEFPANGLRYRYTCTTNSGSSGSPVFDANLDLIGLHHAAEPGQHPAYNQAIPAYLVGRAIAAAGVAPESL